MASVVISGTRVIFSSEEKEVTIKLNNEGQTPSLVQVWLDRGNRDDTPEEVKVPFILTPPLFRLDPNKGQALRMMATKEALPVDRESLFWLNVLEIPPKGSAQGEEKNLVQMAFRTRIKVFYRPGSFDAQARLERAYAQIGWTIGREANGSGYLIEANNPTPYFMTITKASLSSARRHVEIDQGGMIAPFQKKQFQVKDKKGLPTEPLKLFFSVLNDYGSEISIAASVS